MAWKSNAYEGVKQMTEEYARLQIYVQSLVEWARITKQPIPNETINAYHLRVLAYRNFANEVFKNLDEKKLVIDQVVYRQGKPAVDAKGNLVTKRIDGPLFPASFVVEKDAKGIARVSGVVAGEHGGSEIGIIPLVAFAGYAIITALVVVIVSKTVGPVAIEALKQIVFLFRGPIFTPKEISDARVDCLEKARGKTPEEKKAFAALPPEAQTAAVKNCTALTGTGAEGSNWSLILIGLGAIGGVAYVMTRKKE